jgi:hypothetical protein
LADLSNVASTSPTTGQALSWDGSKWAPANVGYIPGSPPPGGFLGNVFYQDNAGNFTQEDAFRYTASTNTLAVENITGTTVTGTGVVKGSNTFGQRYATQAATNRALANTASLTVERYFTVTAEGNGESFNIQSNTPSAGNKIVRKIWYKAEAFEATDVDTWTLLHTFADDATYASTATKWQEYLDGQANGTPPFTLAISWEEQTLFTGLLDTYSGATAAYSLRLLDKDYTGSAVRVRRASDNTEQDIGFTLAGDFDTSALTTFCTGTNGFIRTWYDQSGNVRNATQTTTANQPKIYDSVTGVILQNSKPAIQSVGGASTLTHTSFSRALTSSTFIATGPSSDWGEVWNPGILIRSSTSLRADLSGQVVAFNFTNLFAQQVISLIANGTNQRAYKNGTESSTGAIAITGTAVSLTGILNSYDDGKVQELIYYPSDKSSDRTGIESNISTYYGI